MAASDLARSAGRRAQDGGGTPRRQPTPDPNGHEVEYETSARRTTVAFIQDPAGLALTTEYAYNGLNEFYQVIRPSGSVTSASYNDYATGGSSLPTRVTDHLGQTTGTSASGTASPYDATASEQAAGNYLTGSLATDQTCAIGDNLTRIPTALGRRPQVNGDTIHHIGTSDESTSSRRAPAAEVR